MALSAGMSWKIWRTPLVGQYTSSVVTDPAQPDGGGEAITAEARSAADDAAARFRLAVRRLDFGPDLSPDGGSIGPGADKLDIEGRQAYGPRDADQGDLV
jgi:hypothetical protein